MDIQSKKIREREREREREKERKSEREEKGFLFGPVLSSGKRACA